VSRNVALYLLPGRIFSSLLSSWDRVEIGEDGIKAIPLDSTLWVFVSTCGGGFLDL